MSYFFFCHTPAGPLTRWPAAAGISLVQGERKAPWKVAFIVCGFFLFFAACYWQHGVSRRRFLSSFLVFFFVEAAAQTVVEDAAAAALTAVMHKGKISDLSFGTRADFPGSYKLTWLKAAACIFKFLLRLNLSRRHFALSFFYSVQCAGYRTDHFYNRAPCFLLVCFSSFFSVGLEWPEVTSALRSHVTYCFVLPLWGSRIS